MFHPEPSDPRLVYDEDGAPLGPNWEQLIKDADWKHLTKEANE